MAIADDLPEWDELSDIEKHCMKGLASTFGASGDKVGSLILPTEQEASMIAFEMYTMAYNAMKRYLEHPNARS